MFTLIALASAVFGAFVGWMLAADSWDIRPATIKEGLVIGIMGAGALATLITAAKVILS